MTLPRTKIAGILAALVLLVICAWTSVNVDHTILMGQQTSYRLPPMKASSSLQMRSDEEGRNRLYDTESKVRDSVHLLMGNKQMIQPAVRFSNSSADGRGKDTTKRMSMTQASSLEKQSSQTSKSEHISKTIGSESSIQVSSSKSATQVSSSDSSSAGSSASSHITSSIAVTNSNVSVLTSDQLAQLVDRMEQAARNMNFTSDKIFPAAFKLTFLPQYKSPCWMEDNQLWCLPYFFIGGFPKCGTTELFAKLIEHPEIVKGKRKEPHWWTRSRHMKKSKAFDFYKGFFKNSIYDIRHSVDEESGLHPLVLTEGSASTVWDNKHLFSEGSSEDPPHLNIHAIHSVLPQAKFVLILRNPVTRLYSDYLYFQKEYSPENFHSQVIKSIRIFNDCLRDSDKSFMYCVYAPSSPLAPPLYFRMRIGFYYVHLQVVLSVYPRSSIFIVQLEDYMQDEVKSLRKIMSFLDVSLMAAEDIDKVIQKRKAANSNKKGYKKAGPMLNVTQTVLQEFYKPFNLQLSSLLGDEYIEYL